MSSFLDRLADKFAALTGGPKFTRITTPAPTPVPVADVETAKDTTGAHPPDLDGPPDLGEPAPPAPPAPPAKKGKVAPKAQRFDGPWPLTSTLINFQTLVEPDLAKQAVIPLSLDDAYKGIWVFGGTGSGKTSGSGKHIAYALLRAGYGGVVLTDKAEETDNWIEYAQACGRTDDVIVFSDRQQSTILPEDRRPADDYIPAKCGFNFLQYEVAKSKGNKAQAATDLLMELVGAASMKSNDEIWQQATKKLVGSAILLLLLADEKISLKKINDVINYPARLKVIGLAAKTRQEGGKLTASEIADLEVVEDYLGTEWQEMDKGPKTSIKMNLSTILNPFSTGTMRDLFCGESYQTPDDILRDGKIVIVDLSVKQYNEGGRGANVAWKYCVQRAVQRRGKIKDDVRPVFFFGDEAQQFITPKDGEFAETSRGFRCTSVYLTQNRANLLKKMTKDQVDSLLGNFVCKIFHQNSESATNEWASETIAKKLTERTSMGSSYQVTAPNQGGGSTNTSESMDYQLAPHEFQTLKTGGLQKKLLVQAWLYQGGTSTYASNQGKTFAKIGFNQQNIVI